jgi:hypothetical protein
MDKDINGKILDGTISTYGMVLPKMGSTSKVVLAKCVILC